MEHLMLGLGDLTGLDIIAATEHPSFAIGRSDSGRARMRAAAARDLALGALRRLGLTAPSNGRCRADASRGRSASCLAGARRADCA